MNRSNYKVLVADRKQAKQFKQALLALGEEVCANYYEGDERHEGQGMLVFDADERGGAWLCYNESIRRQEITFKELLTLIVTDVEEVKAVFFRSSNDGFDMFVGDYFYVPQRKATGGGWLKSSKMKVYREWPKDGFYFKEEEAAESWISEQNKPKEIKIQIGMERCTVSIEEGISFFRSHTDKSFFGITGKELNEIAAAHKSLLTA